VTSTVATVNVPVARRRSAAAVPSIEYVESTAKRIVLPATVASNVESRAVESRGTDVKRADAVPRSTNHGTSSDVVLSGVVTLPARVPHSGTTPAESAVAAKRNRPDRPGPANGPCPTALGSVAKVQPFPRSSSVERT